MTIRKRARSRPRKTSAGSLADAMRELLRLRIAVAKAELARLEKGR